MNNKHLSWYEEINNNFIIASRAYFLQKWHQKTLENNHKNKHKKERQKNQMKKITLTQNWQELEQIVSVQVTGGVKY